MVSVTKAAELASRPAPAAVKHYESPLAWILPDGRFFPCLGICEHIWLAEKLGKTEGEAEKAGWIKLTRAGGETLIIGFRKPTDAQAATLVSWGDAGVGRLELVMEWLYPRFP